REHCFPRSFNPYLQSDRSTPRFQQMLRTKPFLQTTKSIIQRLASGIAVATAQLQISKNGEKQCPRNWKGRLHSLRAARAELALQSLSVWPRTERTWPSHTRKVPTRPRRSSRRLNALAERRSQFRRTPLMPAPSKPRSKRPSRHSAASTSS